MSLRRRKPRPLTRQECTYRDDRLFVIATEDTHAPDQYFRIFRTPRIKVRVLPTHGGLSSPKHVLQRLDAFSKEFQQMEDDELWLMLDTDHWVEPNHIQNFNDVCAQAIQKGYHMAHSNPCFEVWLLLHVDDLDSSVQFTRGTEVVERLRCTLGAYNKQKVDTAQFALDSVQKAVERAKRLDSSSEERWPQKTGSHVYRITEKLL